jgi:hypothetical protein
MTEKVGIMKRPYRKRFTPKIALLMWLVGSVTRKRQQKTAPIAVLTLKSNLYLGSGPSRYRAQIKDPIKPLITRTIVKMEVSSEEYPKVIKSKSSFVRNAT